MRSGSSLFARLFKLNLAAAARDNYVDRYGRRNVVARLEIRRQLRRAIKRNQLAPSVMLREAAANVNMLLVAAPRLDHFQSVPRQCFQFNFGFEHLDLGQCLGRPERSLHCPAVNPLRGNESALATACATARGTM